MAFPNKKMSSDKKMPPFMKGAAKSSDKVPMPKMKAGKC